MWLYFKTGIVQIFQYIFVSSGPSILKDLFSDDFREFDMLKLSCLAECSYSSYSRSFGPQNFCQVPRSIHAYNSGETVSKTRKDGKNIWLQKGPVLFNCCYLYITIMGNKHLNKLSLQKIETASTCSFSFKCGCTICKRERYQHTTASLHGVLLSQTRVQPRCSKGSTAWRQVQQRVQRVVFHFKDK